MLGRVQHDGRMTPIPEVKTEVHVTGGVVVGDDGSRCAAHAVTRAAEEAVRRGVPLHVIRAWAFTTAPKPADLPPGVVASLTELEASTLEVERARVADLLAGAEVTVEVHAVHARPAKALLEAAEGADLLVVGTRGLGGFSHLLLGSTAEQVVRHARCDVLVTRIAED